MALQAVEAVGAPEDPRPTVVVEPSGGRLRVVALNGAARGRGIRRGLDLGAAFAFSGALRVLERSHRAERSLLEALAVVGQRFTPSVSLEPPDGLLLEVHASLALFGGLERLRASLGEALATLAPGFDMAVAATPLAALWLARAGGEETAGDTLAARLGRLPLVVTRWPDPVLELLEGIGVTTIGGCLRLPRDGFARRVGKVYLDALDKALGKRADPRAPFDPPTHLDFEVELVDESTSLPVFVDAVTRMTEQLARELVIRHAQVGRLELAFEHRRAEPTVHRLELLERTGNGLRLLELLCDKLERIELPAPATALRLVAGPLEPAVGEAGRLFKGEGGTDGGARARLVERLRGRLGESAVHGLSPAADHRPERAWAGTEVPGVLRRRGAGRPPLADAAQDPATAPGAEGARTAADACTADTAGHGADGCGPWAERPLWLSPVPEPLRSVAGEPQLGGRLRMIEGPERIESGWWDGGDVGRDYFVAVGPSGERLWVFRDRADGRWYLHGRFG
ncbi:MAG TPA: DNA polymerase Y family protein [Gammaproteobacteria bacterium]